MANKNKTTKPATIFFLLLLVGGCAITGAAASADRVLLKDVGALILKPGEMTRGSRSPPLPQLSCNGGVGCHGKYALDSVMCKNMGTDGQSINWECTAEMPKDVKFGDIEVSCEGYDYPGDLYVLVGSCQLRYNLKSRPGVEGSVPTYTHNSRSSDNSGIGLGGLLVGGILLWALGNSCGGNSQRGGYRSGNGPGFWSGVATGAVAGAAVAGGGYRRRRRSGWGWGGRRSSRVSRGRSGGGTYRATGYARTTTR